MIPPPLPALSGKNGVNSNHSVELVANNEKKRNKVKIAAIIACTLLAIVVTLTVSYQISNSRMLEQLHEQNLQAEQRKKEMAIQERQRQTEQEQLEYIRRRQAEQEARELRQHIQQLRNDRAILKNRIKECGVRLRKANEFHFFRTSNEKEREINNIIAERNNCLSQLAAIDAELQSYNIGI